MKNAETLCFSMNFGHQKNKYSSNTNNRHPMGRNFCDTMSFKCHMVLEYKSSRGEKILPEPTFTFHKGEELQT
jgi:hypothetical protein